MGRRLNIPKKLGLGFGLAMIFILVGSFTTLHLQNKNKKIVDRIVSIYEPSLSILYDLQHAVSDTKMLIKNWVFIDYKSNTPSKLKLKELLSHSIINYENQLYSLSNHWTEEEKNILKETSKEINDKLIPGHFSVMAKLQSFDDYNDPMKLFDAISMVQEEDDELMKTSNEILQNIDILVDKLSDKFEDEKQIMESSYNHFRTTLIFLDILIIILIIIIAAIISHMIVTPVTTLKRAACEVGKGNFNVRVLIRSGDEIEVLGNSFNRMAENLQTQRKELEKTNSELTESRESLAASNATKDKFFSILAHDLRAPFNAFISVSDILANHSEKLTDSKKKSFTKSIYTSAIQINNLLENLLHWSRAQTNRINVSPEIIDVEDLVKDNLELLAIPIKKKDLEIVSNIPENTFALGDINLTSTVLRNLLSNGVKFNQEKGRLKIIVSSLHNDLLQISVQDTGIGISQEDIKKLFRIDVDTKYIGNSTAKGTGLGLVLCKEFAEKNGGTIWVESEEGVGSTFSFTVKKYSVNKLEQNG